MIKKCPLWAVQWRVIKIELQLTKLLEENSRIPSFSQFQTISSGKIACARASALEWYRKNPKFSKIIDVIFHIFFRL